MDEGGGGEEEGERGTGREPDINAEIVASSLALAREDWTARGVAAVHMCQP